MKVNQKHIEETLNSLSHGIAALVSIIGFIGLITIRSSTQNLALFSTIVYGLSLIILYTSSTIYHGVRNKKQNRYLEY